MYMYICTWKYHKGTPCVATFISNQLKCNVSHFIFSLLLFYKIGEQEDGTGPAQGGGLAPVGAGKCWEKCVGE
jgi:hypothetical protein